MKVLGLAAKPGTRDVPPRLAGVVLLDRGRGRGVETVTTFHLSCLGDDPAEQLLDMGKRLGEWLGQSEVSVVAAKAASIAAPARRQAAATMRAQMEGAVVATLGSCGLEDVRWGDARALTRGTGTSTTHVQRFALTFPLHLRDAAFAALTAMPRHTVPGAIPALSSTTR